MCTYNYKSYRSAILSAAANYILCVYMFTLIHMEKIYTPEILRIKRNGNKWKTNRLIYHVLILACHKCIYNWFVCCGWSNWSIGNFISVTYSKKLADLKDNLQTSAFKNMSQYIPHFVKEAANISWTYWLLEWHILN